MFTKLTSGRCDAIGANRFQKSLRIANAGASAVILSAVILAQCAIAQGQNKAKKNDQDDLKNANSVFVPADRDLRRVLDGARQAMEEKRYSDAISSLNELINPSQADRSEMEDFFLGTGQDELPRISIKLEAERLLCDMPKAGRELYELQYGADARKLLDDALKISDVKLIAEVSRRFLHTQAGYEATLLLGQHQLDRGHPHAAILAFTRVVESNSAREQFEPGLSLSLAVAWIYAGNNRRAQELLEELREYDGNATLELGGESTRLDAEGFDTLAWIQKRFGQRIEPAHNSVNQWTMFRGDGTRTAASQGGLPLISSSNPLVNCRWQVPTANDKLLENAIDSIHRQYLASRLPALPSLQPLAVGDTILMRTIQRVIAVDFNTGKRIWYFGEPDDVNYSQSRTGLKPSRANQGSLMFGLYQRVWDDVPYGQLSSDGQHLFFIDSLGSANRGPMRKQLVMPMGLFRQNPLWPKSHNQLVALELPSEGKLKWIVGGETGEEEPGLAGVFFLGAPLPVEDKLYVLVEDKREICLKVLSAQTGHVEWSQQLTHLDQFAVGHNVLRRVAGAVPSHSDGVLICPTTVGAVVAVDLATRSLLWGHQYLQLPKNNNRANWGNQRLSLDVTTPGTRWSDNSITVANGKVLLTPVESSEILCLDLVGGKLLWKKPRESLLFIGCVQNEIVTVIGKEQIVGLNMASGEHAWPPIPLPDDSSPSGRGYHDDGHYYLPTTGTELLKIDVAQGAIVEKIPTRQILGNLICYKDSVISQGIDSLTAFYKRDALRETVEQRLGEDPNDADALAKWGEILLHDGQRMDALEVLRRSYLIEPSDATRALLVDTLLGALRDDFAGNSQLADEVRDLIDQPSQQVEFLRIMIVGLQQVEDFEQAFDMCCRLIDLEEPDQIENVDMRTRVRRDRWLQVQLTQIFSKANVTQRSHIDRLVAGRRDTVLNSQSLESLGRFVELYGGHEHVEQVQLELARRQLTSNQLLAAELLLEKLVYVPRRSTAGTATALYAELLEQVSRFDAAARLYQRLEQEFAELICDQEMTGLQIVESLADDSPVKAIMRSPEVWLDGRVDQHELTQPQGKASPRRNTQFFALSDRDQHGPRGSLVWTIDRQRTLVGRNQFGEPEFQLSLAGNRRQATRFSGTVGVSRAAHAGHLCILSFGLELFAINTLQKASDRVDQILWNEVATPKSPSSGAIRYPQLKHEAIPNPWGSAWKRIVDANSKRPVGKFGPINSNGFCFQRSHEIICIDPLKGVESPIWTREGVPAGADLFGDDEILIVALPAGSRLGAAELSKRSRDLFGLGTGSTEEQKLAAMPAMILRQADGHLLGYRYLPAPDRRWTTVGRYVLTWHETKQVKTIVMYDPWEETALWTKSVPAGSKGCLIGHDELALMQPDGRFEIVRLIDRSRIVEAEIEAESTLSDIHVFRSSNQYLVAVNAPKPVSSNGVTYTPAPSGQGAKLFDGKIYAFDPGNGKMQWPSPAVIDQYSLPITQPNDLPVLVFLRHEQKKKTTATVLCIDRRDGRIVLHEKGLPANLTSYTAVGDRATSSIKLQLNNQQLSFAYNDQPRPPEPPAQTGRASSLVQTKGTVLGSIFRILRGEKEVKPKDELETDGS